MTTKRRTALLLFGVVLGAAVGCALGCLVVMKWGAGADGESRHDHGWLHEQLELTPDQEPPMEALEEDFAAIQEQHRKAIREANVRLADAFLEDQSFSERVRQSVDEIHRAQAALQKATIEHLVDMKSVLNDQQYAELLKLTTQSLKRE